MAKPRLIILIRHAQSEGNKNREIHQTIPDHRVKLTQEGWAQAYDAGRRLRAMLRADDTLHFFTSPYRRTRETTEGILKTLTADDPDPSPFKRPNIKVYEEPRLREQDFGNFQPCSAEMERMWQERADYGHFFYRIPNGESAADAYDRISGFNESLWRQFGEDDFASVCVLVTHGLMSRVFLMKWYHFSVEYFEDLRNVNHCEFLIMRKQEDSGKYKLDNKLRTWSELRREKKKEKEDGAKNKGRGGDGSGTSGSGAGKDTTKLERQASIPITRRWGGCPDGCNHGSFSIRSDLAELVRKSEQLSNSATMISTITLASPSTSLAAPSRAHAADSASNAPSLDTDVPTPATTVAPTTPVSGCESLAPTNNGTAIVSRRPAARRFQSFISDAGQECGDLSGDADSSELDDSGQILTVGPRIEIDVVRSREEIVSSPDGTPSFISPDDRVRSLKSPPATGGLVLTSPTMSEMMDDTHLSQGSGDLSAMDLHLGRDFGGTYSGHASQAASSDEEGGIHRHPNNQGGKLLHNAFRASKAKKEEKEREGGKGRGTRACRLGDAPASNSSSSDAEADADDEGDEEIAQMEKKERSVQESVY